VVAASSAAVVAAVSSGAALWPSQVAGVKAGSGTTLADASHDRASSAAIGASTQQDLGRQVLDVRHYERSSQHSAAEIREQRVAARRAAARRRRAARIAAARLAAEEQLAAEQRAAAARRAAERQRAARRRAEQRQQAEQQAQQSQPQQSQSQQTTVASGSPQQIAMSMLSSYGWSSGQFSCLNSLWTRESGWSITATNPSSGAYGIPQALPGSKMASAGSNWQTSAVTQIKWGLTYIQATYGSPCGAWAHEEADGWY
jgi:hypothetical protein